MFRIIALVACLLALAHPQALAQSSPQDAAAREAVDRKADEIIKEVWASTLARIAPAKGLTVRELSVSGAPDERRAIYRAAIDEMDATLNARFAQLLRDNPSYARQIKDEHANLYVAKAIAARFDERTPVSTNGTATNPLAGGLTERSGATTLASLAADLSNGFLNADGTAVSLNLSALALVGLRDLEVYSSVAAYQKHGIARRLSGTVTFGAKVVEREITGLSNLPDFDKLFDVFVWDVKARVIGDKDARSERWFVRSLFLTQVAAVLPNSVAQSLAERSLVAQGVEENQILTELMQAKLERQVRELKAEMARSAQVSVKAAGTHLTKEPGRNKYSFTAMYDQGLGPSDITVNAQYAITDDIRLGAENTFQTKVWTINGSVTSHFAPDVVAAGRTVDLSVGGSATLFADRAALPVEVSNVWRITSSLEFPVKGGGKIPFSVIYTNDANALSKQKYMSGLIGFSYDFSALGNLFKK